MDYGYYLAKAREEAGLSRKDLSEQLGIPYKTLGNYESRGHEPPYKLLARMSEILGCSCDHLLGLDEERYKNKNAPSYSDEAVQLMMKYETLSEESRDFIRLVFDHESTRYAIRSSNDPIPINGKVIPLFGNRFAAGNAEPDFGNAWEQYRVDWDSPADFAIHIHGDSMEPYLPDGSVALGQRRQPKDGDVGAFLLDGAYLVKQYCADSEGNIYLFSLNRKRSDADVTLWSSGDRSLTWFGTILLPRRLPLPDN